MPRLDDIPAFLALFAAFACGATVGGIAQPGDHPAAAARCGTVFAASGTNTEGASASKRFGWEFAAAQACETERRKAEACQHYRNAMSAQAAIGEEFAEVNMSEAGRNLDALGCADPT
jgi:hypothetical protein